MADWKDYLKTAAIYSNPLTQGTAIGNAIYKDVSGGSGIIDDLTGAAKSPGYDTAAEGAKAAQAYLQQLSQLAWDRQMQGLQGALGSFQGYDALTAQMNPRHGGALPSSPGFNPSNGGHPVTQDDINRAAAASGAGPAAAAAGDRAARIAVDLNAGRAAAAPGAAAAASAAGDAAARAARGLPPSYSPPSMPPPGAAPALPPPGGGFAPALPPPGSPIGAAPSLPPPGIMEQLAQMTTARSGQGHF